MSNKITFRADEYTQFMIDKYSTVFGGNRTKTICHIIKSYESQDTQSINLISLQSVAKIVDYLNVIQTEYDGARDICKKIRRELIKNVDDNSIG